MRLSSSSLLFSSSISCSCTSTPINQMLRNKSINNQTKCRDNNTKKDRKCDTPVYSSGSLILTKCAGNRIVIYNNKLHDSTYIASWQSFDRCVFSYLLTGGAKGQLNALPRINCNINYLSCNYLNQQWQVALTNRQ